VSANRHTKGIGIQDIIDDVSFASASRHGQDGLTVPSRQLRKGKVKHGCHLLWFNTRRQSYDTEEKRVFPQNHLVTVNGTVRNHTFALALEVTDFVRRRAIITTRRRCCVSGPGLRM
jgi:hypothetical protein